MAVDMFLKIGDIKGESTDAVHKGEIDIESFSWGATNSGSAHAGGGGGAGKVQMQDFLFVMRVNKASPTLFLMTATGEHIKEAILTARKSGGKEPIEFLKIKFTDILVTSYQQAATAEGDTPNDSFSLNFAKIEVEYVALGRSGQAEPVVKAGWNLAENKKV